MVRLNVFSIYFRSSLFLKTGRAISLFPYFCFWISTRYKNKCGGDLLEISGLHTQDLPQHVHNTERSRMQKAKMNHAQHSSSGHLHRDGLCTLPLILSLTFELLVPTNVTTGKQQWRPQTPIGVAGISWTTNRSTSARNTDVAFYPGVYRGVIYISVGKAVNEEIQTSWWTFSRLDILLHKQG